MANSQNDNKLTLFFLKNLNHQLGPVENFLKKRGYNVVVENDVKVALDKIMDLNPDYIFLAWDHKNENVRTMPKTIYQSCTGQIIPFIMSTQRDQIIQLESSGFENRLYPPLSGPAIIRIISKQEKQNQIFDQINQKSGSPAKKESSMIQVKSFFKEDKPDNSGFNVRTSFLSDEQDQKKVAKKSRGQAQMFATNQAKNSRILSQATNNSAQSQLVDEINSEIDNTNSLSQIQKSSLKNNLASIIAREFSSLGTQASLRQSVEKEVDEIKDYDSNHQMDLKAKLIALIDGEMDNAFPAISADDSSGQTTSSQLSREAMKLSKKQTGLLDKTFNETIKPEMFDLIESFSDLASETSNLKETSKFYTLAIQELEWTGYLIVASENHLDLASAQIILNNWIAQTIRIPNINEDSNEDLADAILFEIDVPKLDFADFCSYKSDFFKEMDFEGKKTLVGFFSFSPFQVINSVHHTFDMLELTTGFLQPNQNLPFDVNLYLAENKKFITYLRPGSFLDDAQVSRLQNRKVEYIYTSMEHAHALLKYKAEFNLSALIQDYKRLKG